MRLTASAYLAAHAASTILTFAPAAAPLLSIGWSLLAAATALLHVAGLWTPVCGVLTAIAAAWHGAAVPSGWSGDLLLGVIGIALSLLGPGAWSLDARLFGWKRLEIPDDTDVDDGRLG